jgi:hypothetical protein
MTRPLILKGDLDDGGVLLAAVDPSARYVTPKLQERQFAATLTPYPDRASAVLALEIAGASNIAEVSK